MKTKLTFSALILSSVFCAQNAQAATITVEDLRSVGAYIDAVAQPNFNYTQGNLGTIHTTSQPPSITLARNALSMLDIAESVSADQGAPAGWQRVQSYRMNSGLYAALYQQDNNLVLAFRGSELGTSDWITNGVMVRNQLPAQYSEAIALARSLAAQYPDSSMRFTGHSLGGGLASAAAIACGCQATVFDAAGLADVVIEDLAATDPNWAVHAPKITNFNLQGEFVSDGDNQQDADTLGPTSRQYGDIYYLSAQRFTPLLIANNGLTRHFTTPLREELAFLSQPVYRQYPAQVGLAFNPLNPITSQFYFDLTDDTLDVLIWQGNLAINSLPSIWQDLSVN